MTSMYDAPDIAGPEDVLMAFTQVMHSEKPSEQLKAAELLAKYHGLFAPKEEAAINPAVIGEIEAAVMEIAARQEAKTHAEASSSRTADDTAGKGCEVVRA